MKYMTDANLAHVAPKLREREIDCDTLHKLMRNNERSEERIVDGEIVAFLRKAQGTVTLITSGIDLADHCKWSNVSYIPIWDSVAESILGRAHDHGGDRSSEEMPLRDSLNDLSSRVFEMWSTTKKILGDRIIDYSDDNWCEDYSADKYFAFILTWGPLKEPGRKSVWSRIENSLEGRPLTDFSHDEIRFPLPWQNDFFKRLIHYLRSQKVSAEEFVQVLRNSGYHKAKATLMQIVQSESEKIVDCWIRDIVKLDAFPIDSNVRKVLSEYGIPHDSDLIVECAKSLEIPVRQFARAVYDEADSIVLHHQMKPKL